jgi:hypothetical protein
MPLPCTHCGLEDACQPWESFIAARVLLPILPQALPALLHDTFSLLHVIFLLLRIIFFLSHGSMFLLPADRLLDTGNQDVIMKMFKRFPKAGTGVARLQVGRWPVCLPAAPAQQRLPDTS